MKKQITLLLSLLIFFGLAHAQTPGTWESLANLQMGSTVANAKAANPNSNLVGGLSQIYSSTGHYTVSADGKGSTSSSMTIRVNKPNAAATVQKVILISGVTNNTIGNGCVTISGVPVNWNGTATSGSGFNFNNYWADVTSIVAAQINGFPAGISNLTITECNTGSIDGEALLVIFNDAVATEKTIIVMFGAATPAGDNFSVTLAQPIDPSQSGALLDMGLGIGFGFQAGGVNQASQVSVNGVRLTSSAGGEDDGAGANGALVTVGGIGDANSNPANPNALPTNARSDDELYNILPFITNTTTSLNINTINPSGDDNIFLAYFALSGAAIIGEGILLSQTTSSGNVGTTHTIKAVIKNTNGLPVPGKIVTFTITAGPNSSLSPSTVTTDANGEALFTYTGTGGAGIDNIQACFINSQAQQSCSNTLSFEWLAANEPPGITCPGNITVSNDPGLCGANVSYPGATGSGTPAPTITYSHASGSSFPVGTTTVTATATNINGSSSCTFTIKVNDTEGPTLTCPGPITVCGPGGVPAADITSVTNLTDNCTGPITVTWQGDVNNCPACVNVPYTITRTYRATDASNNYTECTQTITVYPIPYIACPGNMTETITDVICFKAVSTANPFICGNLTKLTWKLTGATILSSPSSGINYVGTRDMNVGTTTVTYTATFTGGIVKTCSFTVLVKETIAPYILCPPDVHVNTNPGVCYRVGPVNLGTPFVEDNCGIASVTNNAPTVYQKGDNYVTWTVTDKSGNTRTCVQTVTVNDVERPTITCPGNQIYNTGPVCEATPITLPVPVFNDNCGVVTLIWAMTGVTYGSSGFTGINYVPTMNYATGLSTIIYTAYDASGNSRSCTFTVTVKDVTPPTLVCPPAQTFCKVASSSYTIPALSVTDNCELALIDFRITGATSRTGSGTNASGIFNLGVSTIKWTVKDVNGNISTCSATVTILATSNPLCTTTLVDPTYVLNRSGSVTAPVAESKYKAAEVPELSVTAWPNPSVSYFNLKVNSPVKETVEIRMYDMAGKVIQVKSGVPGGTYLFGERVVSGMYIIEVRQGSNVVRTKLFKQ